MSTKVGDAVIIIGADPSEFDKEMAGLPKKAQAEGTKAGKGFGDKFEPEAEKSSKGFSNTFLGNLGANLAGNAITAVGAAAGQAFMAGIAGASNLEQSIGAVSSVFGEYAGQIEKSSMSAATSLGLSRNAFNELATVVGAGLKNKGITDYAGETEKLMGLGADLAAQYGGSTKEAMEAISSLMRGEADPIERYGVGISETAVAAELAAKGQEKLTGAALETAKTQARLAILFKQTSDAQGAYGRESETHAGRQARAAAAWEDTATKIGGVFLPVISAATGFLADVAIPGLNALVTGLEGVGSILGTGDFAGADLTFGLSEDSFVIDVLFRIREGFISIWESIQPLGGALTDLWSVLSPVLALIAGAALGVFVAAWETLQVVIAALVPVITTLAGFLAQNATLVQTVAVAVLAGVAAWKAMQLVMVVAGAATKAWAIVSAGIPAILAAVRIAILAVNTAMRANPIGFVITLISALVAGLIYAYKNSETFRDIVNGVWEGIKTVVGAVVGWFVDTVVPFFVGLWESLSSGAESGAAGFTGVWQGVKDFFAGLWDGIKSLFSGALSFILDLFFKFHPLGIIIANWDAIGAFFARVWEEIKSTFSSALGFITELFLNWTTLGLIIQHWEPIVGFFVGLWDRVVAAVMFGLNKIWTGVAPWIAWFMGVFQAAWGVLQFLIALPIQLAQIAVIAAWGLITSAFSAAWSWVAGTFMGWWSTLTGLVSGVMTAVLAAVTKVWADITAAFTAAWSWVAGTFMGWYSTLAGLIGAVMTAVQNVVNVAWQWITDRFTQAWTWISGVFMGWYTTLSALISAVMTVVQNVINAAWQWITDRFTAAWTWVSGTFMGWYTTLSVLIAAVMTAVQNAIGAAWQWITDRFTQAWNWMATTFIGWWTTLTSLMERPIQLAREAIDRILTGIRTGFEQAVNFIQGTWDRIKQIVRTPVEVAIKVGNWLIDGFKTVAVAVGLDSVAAKLVPIPPMPAFDQGSATGILPGTASGPGDNMIVMDRAGRGVATIRSGEAIIPEPVTRANRGLIEDLIAGRTLPGFFQGGVMPTTAGAINPHPLPYYGAQWAGDFPRPMGTGVFAWRPGTVAQTMYSNASYGNRIRINHPDGFGSSLYAHLSQIGVQVGQAVAQGARIGAVGTTGNSSGPHLHWERLGSTAAISASGSATATATPAFDWVGDLLGKFASPLQELASIGDSPVGAIVKQVPKMIADGMVDKVRTAAAAMMDSISGSAGAATPGVAGAPLSGIGVTPNTAAKGGEIAATARAAGHGISAIGGYRGDGEHVTRRALDFMVGNKASGDFISDFVLGNRGRYGLQHVIWWQRINSGTGWRGMADRGSPTQNHMDHPHVLFNASDVGLDSGGWLKPGLTLANNSSGKPEPVFSAGQFETIDGILSGIKAQQDAEKASKTLGGGKQIVQHINIHNPVGEPGAVSVMEASGEIAARLVGV